MKKILKNSRGDIFLAMLIIIAFIMALSIFSTAVYETKTENVKKICIMNCNDEICIKKCENLTDEKAEELSDCLELFTYEQCKKIKLNF